MGHAHRLVLAFALIALGSAAPASANTPPGNNSTIPGHVVLVGLGAAGPDSAIGHCTVIVRDLANVPIANSHVWFDFSACTDMAPAVDQRDPRLVVNCDRREVLAVTDANGVARFTLLGAATAGPPSPPWAVTIWADGVLLGYPSMSVLERDGVGGLTLNDLALWTADFFSGTDPTRSDFDGSGSVNIADLSVWAAAYFGGNNTASMGTHCP